MGAYDGFASRRLRDSSVSSLEGPRFDNCCRSCKTGKVHWIQVSIFMPAFWIFLKLLIGLTIIFSSVNWRSCDADGLQFMEEKIKVISVKSFRNIQKAGMNMLT